MALRWNAERRRYRDTDTGRLLTRKQATTLRDDLADAYGARFRDLTRQYGEGTISRQAWERGYRSLVVEAAGAGYAFGRGGAALMTDVDFDRLLPIVTTQLGFAETFFEDVQGDIEAQAEERLVDEIKRALLPQMEARAEMYSGSVVNAYEHGHATAVTDGGLRELPAFPADGGTPCLSGCRCEWVITERDGMWECRWITEGDGSVCDGCRDRRRRYNPLVVPMEA